MHDQIEPKLTKWPFFLGDALLLGTAYFVCTRVSVPLGFWEMTLIVFCVAGGACLAIIPFILEYRALVKVAEAGALTTVMSQIQNLEAIAGQISGATGRWQNVQEESEKVAAAAKGIAERMQAEAASFKEFMQKVNDSEKATLRLEVEKLHRAENDWLQVLVRMLDHVYALHLGAMRSGQRNLIEQLDHFQSACRDAAHRVGLTPFEAVPSEPFDGQRHQVLDGNGTPPAGAVVAETVATGYTFQGRMLRPALVRLGQNGDGTAAPETKEAVAEETDSQSQLPLENEGPK